MFKSRFLVAYPFNDMIIGLILACVNGGASSNKLEKYNTKAIDVTEWGQMETGTVSRI